MSQIQFTYLISPIYFNLVNSSSIGLGKFDASIKSIYLIDASMRWFLISLSKWSAFMRYDLISYAVFIIASKCLSIGLWFYNN